MVLFIVFLSGLLVYWSAISGDIRIVSFICRYTHALFALSPLLRQSRRYIYYWTFILGVDYILVLI